MDANAAARPAPPPIHRPRRLFVRGSKWTGTVLCVAALIACVNSYIAERFLYQGRFAQYELTQVEVRGGAFVVTAHDFDLIELGGIPNLLPYYSNSLLPSWSFYWRGAYAYLYLPLWIPVVALLIPAALLWYLDRRPAPGACRCGYDLTGNTSGQCPECGRCVERTT